MKILSIILIGIASFGVVAEFKSDKEVLESIPRYVVIALFYIWAYLAQRYNEVRYKGGIKTILGVFLFGFGIVGLVSSLFSEVSKYSFSGNSLLIISLLAVIFTTSIFLIVYGHKQHRKIASDKSNT